MKSAFRFVVAGAMLLPACALDSASDDGVETSSEAVTTRSANGPDTPPPRASDLVVWLTPDALLPMLTSTTRSAAWHDKSGKATITWGPGVAAGFSGLSPHLGVTGQLSSSFVRATFLKGLANRPFSVFMVARDELPVNDNINSRPYSPGAWLFHFGEPSEPLPSFGLFDHGTPNMLDLQWSNGGFDVHQQFSGLLWTSPHLLTMHRHGMGVDVWVDRQPYYQSTNPLVYNVGGLDGLAPYLAFAEKPGVWYGDVLVYDADLSAADVTNVQTYLRGRYGL